MTRDLNRPPARGLDRRGRPDADRPLRRRPGVASGRTTLPRPCCAPWWTGPGSIRRSSRTSSSAVPTRPARTTATSRGWPCCSPDFPVEVGGLTVNRLCGSGLQAINSAAHAIAVGDGDVFIGGGVESMTRAPYVQLKAEGAVGSRPARDGRHDPRLALRQPAAGRAPLPVLDGRDRGERRRALGRLARAPGRLRAREPAACRRCHRGRPLRPTRSCRSRSRNGRASTSSSTRDEHPRADTSLEALARLRPAFRPDGGSVTAGNSSGINDGASAVLLVEAERARALGLKPMARVVATAVAGVDPAVMGIGPIPATRKALERAGIGIDGPRPRSSSTRRSPPSRSSASTSSASTRPRSTSTAARSRSAIRWA